MRSISEDLRSDPLDYVESLKSPVGIYLRREVFGRKDKSDATLSKKLHKKIVSGQSSDGSWDQLFVHTANRLWDLALLGYGAKDKSVKRGLDWLLTNQTRTYYGQPGFFQSSNRRDSSLMRETSYGEFGPGCTIFYQTAYAVHLFHILNLDNKQTQQTVRSYLKFWTPEWCGTWCRLNVLRVLIEHPLSAKSRRVQAGVRYLAERQTKTGSWKGYPFYHTFHALTRSDSRIAKNQIENTLPSVIRRQNKNSSWGKTREEQNSFLVLDGLKNLGVI